MSEFVTNAELRIEAERLVEENEELRAENAKLRELVRDYRFCAHTCDCLRCPHGRFCDLHLDSRYFELGIKADK